MECVGIGAVLTQEDSTFSNVELWSTAAEKTSCLVTGELCDGCGHRRFGDGLVEDDCIRLCGSRS